MTMAGILGNGMGQPGILGMQPQQPGQPPRIPFGQNPIISTLAAGLLSGRKGIGQGLENFGQALPYAMNAKMGMQDRMVAQQEKDAAKTQESQRNAAINAWIKAQGGGMGLSAEEQALIASNPELGQQLFGERLKAKFAPSDPTKGLMEVDGRIYDAASGQWITPPDGMGGAGGPYEGTGMDNQNWNIILKGDTTSPAYEAAYTQLFAEKMVPSIDASGNQVIVPVKPPVPPGIKPPVGMAQVPAPVSGDPGADPRVGKPVVVGTPKPSDTQMNAGLYADRMTKSNEIITGLEQAGTSYEDAALSNAPLGVGNYLISDEYRQLDQAQRDFVNATLRRESGAVISPQEFDNAKKQYFPQPGDDPTTIEQKRANRETAINGIARAAGPAYEPPAMEQSPAPGSPVSWEEYFKQ